MQERKCFWKGAIELFTFQNKDEASFFTLNVGKEAFRVRGNGPSLCWEPEAVLASPAELKRRGPNMTPVLQLIRTALTSRV